MSLNEQMTGLMDAVRSKSGVSGKLTINKAAEAINSITLSGVVLPEGINVTPADVRQFVFYIDADGQKQEGTMNELVASPIIIDTAGDHVLADGYYQECTIMVYNDNLDEINIRAGVNVFGIDGTFTGDATATAADIAWGKTAGVNGQMITGTMEASSGESIELYKCASYYNPADKEEAVEGDQVSVTGAPHNWTGYKLTQNEDGTWSQSDEATGWMQIDDDSAGYIPEVGKIYSADRTLKIAAAYPEAEAKTIEFLECSYYQRAAAGEPLYPKILTLCDWSLAGKNAENMASGIYYPENIIGDQATWSFARSGGQYVVYVEKSADDTNGRIVVFDNSAGAVVAATGYMELENIWDVWQNEQGCTLYLPDEAEYGYIDGYAPYYFCNIVEWGNGNMFVISDAGSSEVDGLYVRGRGCEEFFSAGCYDCWVNADGTAAIYHIEDWITDEEEKNIFGLLIQSNGSVMYELPTADWDYDTVITSAAQFASYTWRAVNGATPLPILSDGEPELSEPTPEEWSGYLMQWELADCIEVRVDDYGDNDDYGLDGVYRLVSSREDVNTAYMYYQKGNKGISLSAVNKFVTFNILENDQVIFRFGIRDYERSKSLKELLLENNLFVGDMGNATITFTDKSHYYWKKTDTLKSGNVPTVLTPRVGEIYSADTSIRVRKMYDGAVYPITSDGLVFYAPLQTDYVDMVSGQAATVTDGTFTTHNGLSCLQLDGSRYVKWADNADLPAGNVPYSFVVLVAPDNNYDWKCYMAIGYEGSDEIAIHAKNGNLEEFGGTRLTTDGVWYATALTRDADGNAKTYINGKLGGTGERTNAVPSPAYVCVGAQANSFTHKFSGYIAFAAIYNRELSAEEVAGIHAVLMEDVEQ